MEELILYFLKPYSLKSSFQITCYSMTLDNYCDILNIKAVYKKITIKAFKMILFKKV